MLGTPTTASAQNYPKALNITLVPNGPHTITAVGRDAAGNEGTSAPVHIVVDNGDPYQRLDHVARQRRHGLGTIPLDADWGGGATGNERLLFRVNGALVGGPRAHGDPAVTWDTPANADGVYTLKASIWRSPPRSPTTRSR